MILLTYFDNYLFVNCRNIFFKRENKVLIGSLQLPTHLNCCLPFGNDNKLSKENENTRVERLLSRNTGTYECLHNGNINVTTLRKNL